jgi:hydroxymethylglutaryl-CoA lyase
MLRAALPDDELYGFTPDAGLPLGFKPATVVGSKAQVA